MVNKPKELNEKAKKALANAEKLNKSFNKEYKKLIKQLGESGVNVRDDATTLSALKTMLRSTLQMVPIAKKAYMKYPTQGTAFSYTALVSKCAELMDAIRSVTDAQEQVDHIQHIIIESSVKMMLQSLSDELYEFKRWASLEFDKKSAKRINARCDVMLKNHGVYLKELVNKIQDDLTQYLVEPK